MTAATVVETGRRQLRWLGLVALSAVAALLVGYVAAAGAPEPVASGLPDAGLFTAWAMPVARLAFELAAVATVGALVTVLLTPSRDGLPLASLRALRVAGWCCWTWSATTVALILFTVSDVFAVPVSGLLTPDTVSYVWELPQTRALLVVAAAAIVLAPY
ncbi:MAG: hypothetical protein ACRDQ0_11105, partial [Pseudonocardia sp.]